ncbi:hypothetical protein [Thermoactinomyces mirandus]|uniref:Uncharacterized protein n=1 Tax=Thermoactinomyces mirandus TaxID=2756294 RepID=A0A7W1XUX8_9BACL|nr:hypothetical protein [Thermoactinomyces mirandus]MBA4603445.1 hypothetical protein [Thermoactinomyces mirandus]
MSKWVYWAKLYDSRFQANCLAARMQEDWWLYGYDSPEEVEIFRSKKAGTVCGTFGVKNLENNPCTNKITVV